MEKVFVCGKDGDIQSSCNSTYEEINMRTLNSFFSALITHFGC